MKRVLTRVQSEMYYFADGVNVSGPPESVSGDLSDADITDEDREKGIQFEDLIL